MRALGVLTELSGEPGLAVGGVVAADIAGGGSKRVLGVIVMVLPGVTEVCGVAGLSAYLVGEPCVATVDGTGEAGMVGDGLAGAGDVGVSTAGGAGITVLGAGFDIGVVVNRGVKALMNFLFLRVILLDPSIRILYCWNGSVSTITPLLSHFLGELPV